MSTTPNIKAAQPATGRSVIIIWQGGAESVVDLSPLLNEFAIFKSLRGDAEFFKKVEVGEWGWCLHWTDDIEISADTLWRLALEQGGQWLRAWRNARCLTQSDAARALGVSPRMWRYYEAGSHLLPKTVRLAGIGLDALTKAA